MWGISVLSSGIFQIADHTAAAGRIQISTTGRTTLYSTDPYPLYANGTTHCLFGQANNQRVYSIGTQSSSWVVRDDSAGGAVRFEVDVNGGVHAYNALYSQGGNAQFLLQDRSTGGHWATWSSDGQSNTFYSGAVNNGYIFQYNTSGNFWMAGIPIVCNASLAIMQITARIQAGGDVRTLGDFHFGYGSERGYLQGLGDGTIYCSKYFRVNGHVRSEGYAFDQSGGSGLIWYGSGNIYMNRQLNMQNNSLEYVWDAHIAHLYLGGPGDLDATHHLTAADAGVSIGGRLLVGGMGIRYENLSSTAHFYAFGYESLITVWIDGAYWFAIPPSSSDERLKTNIVPSEIDALGLVNQLEMIEFDRTMLGDTKHFKSGVRGQQLEQIMPDTVVKGAANGHIPEQIEVDTLALCGYMLKAIQQLSAKVATLEGGV
jgi:hypothetical protein